MYLRKLGAAAPSRQLACDSRHMHFGAVPRPCGVCHAQDVATRKSPLPMARTAGQVKVTFKASSIPHGARYQDVGCWISRLKWKARPLRQLSVQTWMIGAETPPPARLVSMTCPCYSSRRADARSTPAGGAGRQGGQGSCTCWC